MEYQMKKLLIGLLALSSLSTLAGTLENKTSGEYLNFELNEQDQKLIIVSTSPNVPNKTIDLMKVDKSHSSINVFAGSSIVREWSDEGNPGLFLAPVLVGYDLLLLAVKAPVKAIENNKLNKDFETLMSAINSNETIVVPSKRFNRISKLLMNK
jgi:hypothetical protein